MKKPVKTKKKTQGNVLDFPTDKLYSLHFSSDTLTEDGDVFQDFKVSRKSGDNINAVHLLWADTFTNSAIKALIYTESKQNFLRVWFENRKRMSEQGEEAKGWASNIKIKPRADSAFKNYGKKDVLKYRYMKFSARVPKKELSKNDLKEVGVSVRLLDRRLTYWSYSNASKGGQPSQFNISDSWQEYKIDLISGSYSLFDADGNNTQFFRDEKGAPKPDFSIVAGIVFVVGSYTGGIEEPGLGKGVVDFKNVVFGNG